jgi:hypothetical protein
LYSVYLEEGDYRVYGDTGTTYIWHSNTKKLELNMETWEHNHWACRQCYFKLIGTCLWMLLVVLLLTVTELNIICHYNNQARPCRYWWCNWMNINFGIQILFRQMYTVLCVHYRFAGKPPANL